MTFLDTNVLFDILHNDERWLSWSLDALLASSLPRLIGPVVYAELSSRYDTRVDLDGELDMLNVTIEEPSRAALFGAGRAHAAYRRRGGQRDRVLPDFLIGAQAADRDAVLITRDGRRYRTAFPGLGLITP